MIQAIQKMQQCMATIDQGELKKLEQKAEEIDTELRDLCGQGERGQAQAEAVKFSKKMKHNPVLIQMNECSEITKGFVPEGTMKKRGELFDPSNGHVCDGMD
jgi:hypothetical protein